MSAPDTRLDSFWSRMSDDELRGADWALRRLHSSPTIKGRALEVLVAQIHEIHAIRSERLIETVGCVPARETNEKPA